MMPHKIVVTINHQLDAELVRRRVEARLDQLRQDYVEKIARCDISWSGNVATIKASALGHSVLTQIFLTEKQVRIEASLPWMLASLSGKIENLIMKNAKDTLTKN